jgi:hypothetical protein
MSRIGLLLISTGKYDIFLKPLIDSVDKFFFRGEKIDIYIFADKPYNEKHSDRIEIQVMEIKHSPFPYATLYRYKHFNQYKNTLASDYLFYLDVDMKIVGIVGEEILPDESGLTATIHPGFWHGGGSWCTDTNSLAYTTNRNKYYAGGFQGGARDPYLSVCKLLSENIQKDEDRGVLATWHDESHWNCYLSNNKFKEISPSYCFPEASWAKGMPFVKRIMALDKNHAEIRK